MSDDSTRIQAEVLARSTSPSALRVDRARGVGSLQRLPTLRCDIWCNRLPLGLLEMERAAEALRQARVPRLQHRSGLAAFRFAREGCDAGVRAANHEMTDPQSLLVRVPQSCDPIHRRAFETIYYE